MTADELTALRVSAIAGQFNRDAGLMWTTRFVEPVLRFSSLIRLGMVASLITVRW